MLSGPHHKPLNEWDHFLALIYCKLTYVHLLHIRRYCKHEKGGFCWKQGVVIGKQKVNRMKYCIGICF